MVVRRDFGSYRRADANGIAAPLASNIGWGVLPLYWRALSSMNAISVLAYRLVATLAAMVALSGVLRPGHRDSAGHVLLRRAAQPLPDREFHPISQPADPVLCGCAPAARTDARAGLCGVHGDLGRDRGVFVRRDSGVLGAAEAPRTLSASLTPLPEGSSRRRRLRGGRHGKQQKPRSRPKPQTPLTKQACTSSP